VLDAALRAFLDAPDEGRGRDALEVLISQHLNAVITQAVGRTLGRSRRAAQGCEDAAADARLRVVQRLLAWRAGSHDPIDDLPAYTATVATNAAHGWLRREFPERTRLQNKVRYVATHHSHLVVEQRDSGSVVRSTRVRPAPRAGSSQALLDDPIGFRSRLGLAEDLPLPAMLAALLDGCETPVALDRLCDVAATLLGISDAPVSGATAGDEVLAAEAVADPSPAVDETLAQQASLAAVWAEIVTLPPRQRAALLLNLRDPDGGALVHVLPTTGIVTTAQLAQALEMDEEALTRLWPDLPLDDRTIAARLGITRQQVINLRKSGRARLARRLGGQS
jgi:DNA-directed RNA polymerase specialized sigma24 family protein